MIYKYNFIVKRKMIKGVNVDASIFPRPHEFTHFFAPSLCLGHLGGVFTTTQIVTTSRMSNSRLRWRVWIWTRSIYRSNDGMDIGEECLSMQSEVEGMYTTGNHMEVVGMDTIDEHMSKRMEMETMDMMNNHMMEDTTSDLEWVERVHGGVVVVKH
jgi:hypothetical protein